MTSERRLTLGQFLVAFGAYALISLAWFWSVVGNMSGVLYGGGDSWNYAWRIWWFAGGYQMWGGDPFFAPQIFYPFGHHVAEAELTPLQMAPAAVVSSLTSPVFAYNAVVWASFIVAGLAMYVYLRWIGVGHWAGVVGGFVYGFSPYHSAHALGHLPLMGIWVLPLGMLAIEGMRSAIEEDAPPQPHIWRWAALLGLSLGLAGWSSWYYLVIFGVGFAVYGLARLRGPKHDRRRLPWRALALALLIGVIMVAPFYYISVTKSSVPSPDWSITKIKGAAPIAYVVPSAFHRWWGELTRRIFTRNPVEDSLFVGWIALALAVWGWWRFRRDNPVIRSLTVTLGVLFVLSLGPFLYMGPRLPVSLPFDAPDWLLTRYNITEMSGLPIPLPAIVLGFLPIFSGMREYTRFGVVVMFCVAALAALGVEAAVEALSAREWRRPIRFVAAAMLMILLVAEFVPTNVSRIAAPSSAESWLAENVEEGVVFYLPDTHYISDEAMFKTVYTGLPIACGDATLRPQGYEDTLEILEGFPDEASRLALVDLGVTHVIWRTEYAGGLPQVDWLTPVVEFEDQAVLELR